MLKTMGAITSTKRKNERIREGKKVREQAK
jgi:hypothetical protein